MSIFVPVFFFPLSCLPKLFLFGQNWKNYVCSKISGRPMVVPTNYIYYFAQKKSCTKVQPFL